MTFRHIISIANGCVLISFLWTSAIAAEIKETAKDAVEIKSPSPDGEFAFLETVPAGAERREGTVDLIEAKTKKVLVRVDDEIDVAWSALWSPDSRKFAFTYRVNHPMQGMDLYVRRGKTFRKLVLPTLEANIPAKMKRGHDYPHMAALDYISPVHWNKDGSLTITIDTMLDGADATVTASKRVVLGFDRAGKVEVVSSRVKYGRGE
jgi:hypothetical protein